MSDLPLINKKEEGSLRYTVVGPRNNNETDGNKEICPISLVILNRANKFQRANIFLKLSKMNFKEIISIENSNPVYDIENLSSAYRNFKMIFTNHLVDVIDNKKSIANSLKNQELSYNDLKKSGKKTIRKEVIEENLKKISNIDSDRKMQEIKKNINQELSKDISIGEKINIAIKEACSDYVFVVWSDMILNPISLKLISKIEEDNNLCTIPTIRNHKSQMVQNIVLPKEEKKSLKIVNRVPTYYRTRSLFPLDYIGIYNKSKFLEIGGYDSEIKNSVWQKMDFGYRVYTLGHEIINNLALQIGIDKNTLIPEDFIVNEENSPDYKRFYLKNMLFEIKDQETILSNLKIIEYLKTKKKFSIDAVKEFLSFREEIVKTHFKHTAKEITELLEDSIEEK